MDLSDHTLLANRKKKKKNTACIRKVKIDKYQCYYNFIRRLN